MRVTVQYNLGARRHPARRNMSQKKLLAGALQLQLQRPEIVRFIVAEHDVERFAQLLKRGQGRRVAHIAEMPDFIRALQPRRQIQGKPVVGVGEDRDTHHLAATVPASGT